MVRRCRAGSAPDAVVDNGARMSLFFDAGWFVEVQLIKNSAEGNPGVLSVAVLRDEP